MCGASSPHSPLPPVLRLLLLGASSPSCLSSSPPPPPPHSGYLASAQAQGCSSR
jgi:hypothetical protein